MQLTRRQILAATMVAGCKSRAPEPEPHSASPSPEARTVQTVITPTSTIDGAGVHISRVIGGAALPMADPFLLLDHIRSRDPSEYEPGFPKHPHRGFETVTIMIEGAIEHRDSMGNHGRLTGGSIQWMTAGHGIIHSEMPQRDGDQFWGLQLWVNLPKKLKMTAPRYQDLAKDRVPSVGRTRVLAGAHDKTSGPVEGIVVAPTILDVSLAANEDFLHELPVGHAAVALVLSGTALMGATRTVVKEKQLGVFGAGTLATLRGSSDPSRVLVIAAAPIGEPVARRGPFVMSTEEELDQAWDDFHTGRLTEI